MGIQAKDAGSVITRIITREIREGGLMGRDYKKSYVSEFLSLRCAGDVLNVLNPITRAEKEITESMAMIKQIKKIALKEPMKYTLIDLCAGNALTSALSVFLFPIHEAIAIDRKKRNRKWGLIKRFTYLEAELYPETDIGCFNNNIVLTATHACGDAAYLAVDLYNKLPEIKHLVLMPCCIGQRRNNIPDFMVQEIGKYKAWAYDLSLSCRGRIIIDKKCLSPCNAIIVASK